MTLYDLANAQILVGGIVSITLIATPRLQWWGFALGLANSWAWWYVAIHDGAWGVLLVNVAYVFNYLRAIRNYWRFI